MICNLTALGETSRGYRLYVKDGEQGREYWSDEVGGGVLVWQTALVSAETLQLALLAEKIFEVSGPDWPHLIMEGNTSDI